MQRSASVFSIKKERIFLVFVVVSGVYLGIVVIKKPQVVPVALKMVVE